MRFPIRLCAFRLLLSWAVACSVCGCSPVRRDEEPRAAAAEPKAARASLPARAEAVASADALAVLGTKRMGREGALRLLEAASLRERIFRVDHREADALEAIELYRQAARSEPALGCDALTSAALLEGELRADPRLTFQAVERARVAKGADGQCQARAEAILNTLGTYRAQGSVALEGDDERSRLVELRDHTTGPAAPDDVVVPKLGSPHVPSRVIRVERYGAADAARIVVYLSEPSTYKVGSMQDGSSSPRLFIDIEGASYDGTKSFEVGGLVARVRLGAQATGTRVVLDLNATAYRHVFYVPEPFRLVIDVSKDAPTSTERVTQGVRPIRRVVLDPGHGGHDPGALGPSGLREKDVTLDIAHRAAPLIARELGISTLLTRDGDDYVALDERTARANAFQADLFISIHCNASEDGAVRGVMTFVLDDSRDPTSTRVAARENEASAEAAAELAGALSRGDGGQSSSRSNHFAELLQRSAIASLSPNYRDIPNSGIRRAGFYVLAGARMPAVLFETSFISNSVSETRFNTGDFRQKIADAIVNAVRAYRDGL